MADITPIVPLTGELAMPEKVWMQGPQGPQGQQGEPGAAATVTVGTVTTGEPGTDAIVTNSGTESAAVLNFTIPRGETGAAGQRGPKGDPGPAGADGKDGAGIDITGATVGQIAKIAAVDDTGKPTAWEASDMPSGGSDDVYTIKRITNYGTSEKELQGDYAGAIAAFQSGKKLKFVDALNYGGQEVVNAESFSYTFGQSGEIIFVTYLHYSFVTYELTESGVTVHSETRISSLYVNAARSLFLKSDTGKQFRVIVSDTGELSTEEVT